MGASAWASSTTSSAGATDNSTGWNTWSDGFTKNYTLSGNGSYQFTFYTTNATTQAYYGWSLFVGNTINTTNVWDSWMICRSGLADAWGTRTAAKGSATTTNTYSTENPSGSGIASAMNGAMVTATVKRTSENITVVANVTPASENPFSITWTYTYGEGDDTTADLYLCFGVDNAYLNITSTRQIADGYAATPVLSENYETLTADADIISTLGAAGWSFNGRSGTNPTASCIQGSSTNISKYAKIQYPNIAGDRAQIWTFDGMSALNTDNWTLSFSAALTPANTNPGTGLGIIGTSSTYNGGSNSNLTNPFFKVFDDAKNSTTYTAVIGSTTLDGTYTLASGTWYKYTIKVTNIDASANTANVYVKITTYDETSTILEVTQSSISTASIGTLKGFIWLTPRANMPLLIDDVLLTKDVVANVCAEPSPTITGANGVERKFTLSCETEGATIYYSATELEAGAAGWTEYTGEVTTTEGQSTIYIYAAKDGYTSSEVTSFSTGRGSEIQLNTPTITRSSNTTVTITSNQAGLGNLDVDPVPTLYYTYGEEEGTFTGSKNLTVSADATITVYAVLDGYTPSGSASRAVALFPTTMAQIENSTTPSGSTNNHSYETGVYSEDTKTVSERTYAAFIKDGEQWGNNIYFQTGSVWGIRNNGTWYTNQQNNSWLLMENMKENDIIVADFTKAASGTVNATYSEKYSYGSRFAYTVDADGDVELNFTRVSSNANNYFNGLYAYSNYVAATLGTNGYATFASPYALDLTTANLPAGVTAYKAAVDGTTVTFTAFDQTVPANTGMLLKGIASTTVNIPVAVSGSEVSGNAFLVNEGGTTFTGDDSYYYFGLKANTLTFGLFDPSSVAVPANKAYLKVLKSSLSGSEARLNVMFDDEATGISTIENAAKADGYYNLSGQRVAQPSKGLYIVNGKKVIIK